MVRHSFVAYRDDWVDGSISINFNDDRWQNCVPIRRHGTLCLEEKVPSGAVAVLINRNQTESDLYLPISMRQKRLFDSIDGNQSAGQIMRSTRGRRESASAWRKEASAFFEQLWWFDPVVFDCSMCTMGGHKERNLAETTQ